MPVSYIHFYIHFTLFAENRSRPPTATHCDFWLDSAKYRIGANNTDHPQTGQPRTHKPLVAGSNPAAATNFSRQDARAETMSEVLETGHSVQSIHRAIERIGWS
jgi:hypothetical protein